MGMEQQKERALNDAELLKEGAEFKEDGRLEVTAGQVEEARKEMEAENPEAIKALDTQLEGARESGEAFIAGKEQAYNAARLREKELDESMKEGGAFHNKAEGRITRDKIIAGLMGIGALGAGFAVGGPVGSAIAVGLFGGTVATMFSPVARIQNWLEKKKLKKGLSDAKESKVVAEKEYSKAAYRTE